MTSNKPHAAQFNHLSAILFLAIAKYVTRATEVLFLRSSTGLDLKASHVQDPSGVLHLERTGDAYRNIPRSDVSTFYDEALVCGEFVARRRFRGPSRPMKLYFLSLLQRGQRDRLVDRRTDQTETAILRAHTRIDGDLDTAKIIAAACELYELLFPSADIGQSVAAQIQLGGRVLRIRYWPHRLHAIELLQCVVSATPARAEPVGASRCEANDDMGAGRGARDRLIERGGAQLRFGGNRSHSRHRRPGRGGPSRPDRFRDAHDLCDRWHLGLIQQKQHVVPRRADIRVVGSR